MKEQGWNVLIQEGDSGQFELFRDEGTNYNFNNDNWISFMKEGDGIPKVFTMSDIEKRLTY